MTDNDELQKTLNSTATGKADSVLKPGDLVVDRYRIEKLIGSGGMGTVYKAQQIFLKQTVALKMLTAEEFTDVSIRRFQKEAQAASKLTHANLVQAHEFGVLPNGQPYFTMDFVEGPSLSEYTKGIGALSVEECLDIFIPTAFGLAFAHEQSIVHRDIKPSNIMLAHSTDAGKKYVPKIVDFGIAKLTDDEQGHSVALTKTGEVFGTPLYMSPEQCMGGKIDHRSDIYSLGCVIYDTLTGAPPFSGETALSLMMKHQSEIAPSLKEGSMGREFPAELETIVATMLEKNPDDRYQNLFDVAQDLAAVQTLLKADAPAATIPLAVPLSPLLSQRVNAIKQEANEPTMRIWKLVVGALVLYLSSFALGIFYYTHYLQKPVEIKKTLADESDSFDRFGTAGGDIYLKGVVGTGPTAMREYLFPESAIGELIFVDRNGRQVHAAAKKRINIPVFSPVQLEIEDRIFNANINALMYFTDTDINFLRVIAKQQVKDFLVNQTVAFDAGMAIIAHWKNLQNIQFDKGYISDVGMHCLEDLPSLKRLGLHGARITPESLLRLRNFDTLLVLNVSAIPNVKRILPQISKNKVMGELFLSDCDLDNSDVELVSRMKTLRVLDLSENRKITDSGLASLADSDINTLLLAGTSVTPKSKAILLKLRRLKVLQLSNEIWSLPELKQLHKELGPKCEIVAVKRGFRNRFEAIHNWK